MWFPAPGGPFAGNVRRREPSLTACPRQSGPGPQPWARTAVRLSLRRRADAAAGRVKTPGAVEARLHVIDRRVEPLIQGRLDIRFAGRGLVRRHHIRADVGPLVKFPGQPDPDQLAVPGLHHRSQRRNIGLGQHLVGPLDERAHELGFGRKMRIEGCPGGAHGSGNVIHCGGGEPLLLEKLQPFVEKKPAGHLPLSVSNACHVPRLVP